MKSSSFWSQLGLSKIPNYPLRLNAAYAASANSSPFNMKSVKA